MGAPLEENRTRLVVADDHALVRAGLCRLLEVHPGLQIVGEAGDGAEAVTLAVAREADLVLLDLAMPGMGGLEAARRITAAGLGIRVLVVSQLGGPDVMEEALRAGAHGYVRKQSSPAELLCAVDAVRRGATFFSPGLSIRSADGSGAGLSPREREIVALLAEGLSSREIGRALHVSPRTVDTHRTRILRKLGLHKTPQLVRFAIRTGLVDA